MNKTVDIQELIVVVVAKNHNPTILNPDFLKYNGIVPAEWELAESPICTEPVAQVIYKNGINILAQFDKIIFSENIEAKKLEEVKVPGIARKYIETLPHVDYRAVGINPKGDMPMPETEAIRFIIDRLVRPGPWVQFKERAAHAAVRFTYPIEGGKFTLTIAAAVKKPLEGIEQPVVLFEANFHYEVIADTPQEKLSQTLAFIDLWKTELEDYATFINQTFLKEG